jgi:hypothetical protein
MSEGPFFLYFVWNHTAANMKYILLLIGLTSPFYTLSQSIYLTGQVINSQTNKGFWGATLLFKQLDKVVTGGITDSTGTFVVKSIPVGTYSIDIEAIGYRTETVTNVIVSSDTLLHTISFPGPCKYIYANNVQIKCTEGHTDYIVPIVYGMPGRKLLKEAKAKKLYLGGCETTGCDPKYYCLVHEKEF